MLEQKIKTPTELIEQDIADLHDVFPVDQRNEEFEAEVARLRAELEATEDNERGIANLKERNRNHGSVVVKKGEVELKSIYKVTPERTGSWVSKETDITLSPQTSQNGNRFWIGRMTELSHATKLDRAPHIEGAFEEITSIISSHISIKLDAPDKKVRALRPLSRDDLTRQHTALNAYSDDAINPEGFKANDLRALVLEDTSQGKPVFLIASVCRHDADRAQIYNL